jgi:hypothetical protein
MYIKLERKFRENFAKERNIANLSKILPTFREIQRNYADFSRNSVSTLRTIEWKEGDVMDCTLEEQCL